MATVNEATKDYLLSLPRRDWSVDSQYDSVLILSTGEAHDSGWAMMYVIGVVNHKPVEIASDCSDDIEWKLPPMKSLAGGDITIGQMRMDCAIASGAVHAWKHGARFKVGLALSSVTIELVSE